MPALPRFHTVQLSRRASVAIDTAVHSAAVANSAQMTSVVNRAAKAAADLKADLERVDDVALRQSLKDLGNGR